MRVSIKPANQGEQLQLHHKPLVIMAMAHYDPHRGFEPRIGSHTDAVRSAAALEPIVRRYAVCTAVVGRKQVC